jgi:flagellar FliJ protein
MSWRDSLVRIADHEVETLRKRLTEILDRRAALEMKLVMLAAQTEAELSHAQRDAEAGWYKAGFLQGVRFRRAEIQAQIEATVPEEAGARDALAVAFEALKKFEHVAETARVAEVKALAKLETAMLDEMGLRKRAS